ncbi:MAG: diiron oxygenase [Pseudomonadota bacterium]
MTETSAETSALADQLSRNSTPYADPLARVEWDRLSLDTFWMPERALSLYGLAGYEQLSEGQRRSLSHFEFLNAVEAGLWLEGIFMRRIAASVHRDDGDTGDLLYHLHELREEAGHSLMFVELYQRSGLPRPPTAFPRLRLGNLVGRLAPFDSAAFWVAVLIGEEVPDRLNRVIHKHRDEVDPAAHAVARLHTLDEARHIAHAKDRLERKLIGLPGWRRRVLNLPVQRVFRQFVRALYLPQPGLYELAGLDDGRGWARAAAGNPHRIAFIDECVRTTLSTLRSHGFQLDWRH